MNPNSSYNKRSIFRILAICALLISLISFFIPFVTVRLLFAKESFTGFQLIREVLEDGDLPDSLFIFSPLCVIACLIMVLAGSMSKSRPIYVAVITSIGIIVMLIAFGIGSSSYIDISDVADTGFYLYITSGISTIIFSLVERYFFETNSTNERSELEERLRKLERQINTGNNTDSYQKSPTSYAPFIPKDLQERSAPSKTEEVTRETEIVDKSNEVKELNERIKILEKQIETMNAAARQILNVNESSAHDGQQSPDEDVILRQSNSNVRKAAETMENAISATLYQVANERNQISLKNHLEYALKYQSDQGMIRYLRTIYPSLSNEEQEILAKILSLPDYAIRTEIIKLSEE